MAIQELTEADAREQETKEEKYKKWQKVRVITKEYWNNLPEKIPGVIASFHNYKDIVYSREIIFDIENTSFHTGDDPDNHEENRYRVVEESIELMDASEQKPATLDDDRTPDDVLFDWQE